MRTKDAAQIFNAAGLTTGQPEHVNDRVFNLMRPTGRVERISPGVYRLIDPAVAAVEPAEAADTVNEPPENVTPA